MGGLDMDGEVMKNWPRLTKSDAVELGLVIGKMYDELDDNDPKAAEQLLNDFLAESPLRELNEKYALQLPERILRQSEIRVSGGGGGGSAG